MAYSWLLHISIFIMIELKCFEINFGPRPLCFEKDILGLEESMLVVLDTEEQSCKSCKAASSLCHLLWRTYPTKHVDHNILEQDL